MDIFWEKAGWENNDPHLTGLHAMPFRRKFPPVPQKKGLYVVRGPRQIGKTSWLKHVLSFYTGKNEDCFYLSCEKIEDFKELSEILKSVRDRKAVLIDEITFIKNWDRAVKYEVDFGHTNILIITGSHMHDLRRGADTMPGRFGDGGEFLMLPMDFNEFHDIREQAGWASDSHLEELRAFFKTGGFPSAVAEAGTDCKKPAKTMQTIMRWLVGDIIKLGKQEHYLKELIIQLFLTMQTPISHQTLATKTNIGSHNTVQEYVSILESCFALKTLYCVDIDTGAYRFKKDKKFYFTDPLLYWIARDLSGKKNVENHEEKIAEMAAHESLSRKFSRFGYFSGPSGEIDFILPKEWALEIKWASVPSNLSRAYKNMGIPWKTVWSHSNFMKEYP
ncbi:MAG: hypothetical protein A2583_07075 [Bdellovibrionales bacterium RIFOXYD1_FULL_53_11]|nr:MAG: hypothetical protein A2583_07075 [Bdellovibrionales bacterium RIFOXYD1_FULL_53_11]